MAKTKTARPKPKAEPSRTNESTYYKIAKGTKPINRPK